MLAHELRNPLAPIRAAAQILGTPDAPASATDKARTILDRQIQTMTRLIEDLLDVARITQGKLELRKRPADLTAILQRAVDVVQDEVTRREQTLTQVLSSERVPVAADTMRLEQAFGNLLSNASKFTPLRGHINVRMDNGDTTDAAREVAVRVEDDGIGIAPEMLPHVFDLFRQAGESPHHARGMGVGLSLVHRIVTLHGGRIEVHSAGVNHGSAFIVTLPRLQPSEADEGREQRQDTQRIHETARLRMLVVDDNMDAAESLADLLRLRQHDVRVAHDGFTAIGIAKHFQPHVAFLDIDMPGMNGYAIAERLRADPETADVYLVAVTGLGRDEDRRRAANAGFDRHVTKPLDPKMLPVLLARAREGELH
jgi:two-component system CheB/CheR fusion protein